MGVSMEMLRTGRSLALLNAAIADFRGSCRDVFFKE